MSPVEELTPAEIAARLRSGELMLLLDVREPWEVAIAKVDGAVHLPMNEIPARLDELDRDRPVAVICHSGGRSLRVAHFLAASGFGTVANVAGGIDAWSVDVDGSIPRY